MSRSTHRPPYRYMLERLHQARKRAGLTQEAVADLLQTTQTFISKIERGERRIDPVELAEFAALYEQELDFFLLKPTLRQPAGPTVIQMEGEDADVLQQLAYEHGESATTILHRALRAYAGGKP